MREGGDEKGRKKEGKKEKKRAARRIPLSLFVLSSIARLFVGRFLFFLGADQWPAFLQWRQSSVGAFLRCLLGYYRVLPGGIDFDGIGMSMIAKIEPVAP